MGYLGVKNTQLPGTSKWVFFVGHPYKPSFESVTGRGATPKTSSPFIEHGWLEIHYEWGYVGVFLIIYWKGEFICLSALCYMLALLERSVQTTSQRRTSSAALGLRRLGGHGLKPSLFDRFFFFRKRPKKKLQSNHNLRWMTLYFKSTFIFPLNDAEKKGAPHTYI